MTGAEDGAEDGVMEGGSVLRGVQFGSLCSHAMRASAECSEPGRRSLVGGKALSPENNFTNPVRSIRLWSLQTNGLDRDFAHRPFDDSIEEPQLASMLPSLANWTLGMDR